MVPMRRPCTNTQAFFWRNRNLWKIPGIDDIPYYKRELMPETLVYRCYMLLPKSIAKRLMRFAPWRKTAFAVPEEKIVTSLPVKDKLMASHIVDPEVRVPLRWRRHRLRVRYRSWLLRRPSAIKVSASPPSGLAGIVCVTMNWPPMPASPCVRDLDTKSEYCAATWPQSYQLRSSTLAFPIYSARSKP